MKLLNLVYIAVALASKSYVQTLVFGKEKEDGEMTYYCDYNLNPSDLVNTVTIFKVVDGDQDKAVAYRVITPYNVPENRKYHRIDIPAELANTTGEYSFYFEMFNGEDCYSESWTYDKKKDSFALSSSIEKSYLDNNVLIGAIVLGSGIIVLVGGRYVYNKYRRAKAVL